MYDSYDDNDGDEEENEVDVPSHQKECSIFVIDCSESMLASSDVKSLSNVAICMKSLAQCMTAKILSTPKDVFAVILYNTGNTKNESHFPNISVMHDPDNPSAELIQAFVNLSGPDAAEKIATSYGEPNAGSFSKFTDVLWLCSDMFSHATGKLSIRRIFLFTDQDRPNADDGSVVMAAKQRAHDLIALGTRFELLSLLPSPPANPSFDPTAFFQSLMTPENALEPINIPKSSTAFEELEKKLFARSCTSRVLGSMPFHVGGVKLAVKMYALQSKTSKPLHVYLNASDNCEVRTIRKTLHPITSAHVFPEDVKCKTTWGGSDVIFETEEINELRAFGGSKGLQLVCFADRRKTLAQSHNVKVPRFIYPDDYTVAGSTTLFVALLRKMSELDRVAIATFKQTDISDVRFVALVPQVEERNTLDIQVVPPGMHMIFLPFADDLRQIEYEYDSHPKATDNDVEIMKSMLRKMNRRLPNNADAGPSGWKYSPEQFSNVGLARHSAWLESVALELADPRIVPDSLDPPSVEDLAPNEISACRNIYNANYVPSLEPTKKRKVDDTVGTSEKASNKRSSRSTTEVDILTLAASDSLNKANMEQLKDYLRAQGLPLSGRKNDLIDRIKEALNT